MICGSPRNDDTPAECPDLRSSTWPGRPSRPPGTRRPSRSRLVPSARGRPSTPQAVRATAMPLSTAVLLLPRTSRSTRHDWMNESTALTLAHAVIVVSRCLVPRRPLPQADDGRLVSPTAATPTLRDVRQDPSRPRLWARLLAFPSPSRARLRRGVHCDRRSRARRRCATAPHGLIGRAARASPRHSATRPYPRPRGLDRDEALHEECATSSRHAGTTPPPPRRARHRARPPLPPRMPRYHPFSGAPHREVSWHSSPFPAPPRGAGTVLAAGCPRGGKSRARASSPRVAVADDDPTVARSLHASWAGFVVWSRPRRQRAVGSLTPQLRVVSPTPHAGTLRRLLRLCGLRPTLP